MPRLPHFRQDFCPSTSGSVRAAGVVLVVMMMLVLVGVAVVAVVMFVLVGMTVVAVMMLVFVGMTVVAVVMLVLVGMAVIAVVMFVLICMTVIAVMVLMFGLVRLVRGVVGPRGSRGQAQAGKKRQQCGRVLCHSLVLFAYHPS